MESNKLGFDSITFKLFKEAGQDIYPLLSEAKQGAAVDTGSVWYTGKLGNLHVIANDSGIKISNSLAAYLYGDNSRLLTPADVCAAIDKLNRDTGLDFHPAVISRIDIAGDLRLGRPVREYLDRARGLGRMRRGIDGGTVYFTVGGAKRAHVRQLKLYDKEAERGRAETAAGLLRAELSFGSRIAREMGAPVTLGKLRDDELYYDLCRRWIEHMREIEFTYPSPHIEHFEGKREALLFLAGEGIRSRGAERIENLIAMQTPGRARHNLREVVREAEAFGREQNPMPHAITELRAKAEEIYTNSTMAAHHDSHKCA